MLVMNLQKECLSFFPLFASGSKKPLLRYFLKNGYMILKGTSCDLKSLAGKKPTEQAPSTLVW